MLKTEVCEILQIEYPIILAGMAGGPTTPELVAAVSNAGGLGTLGGAYLKPDELRNAIISIRQMTDKPFAVNLFSTDLTESSEGYLKVQEILNDFRRELGIPLSMEKPTVENLFNDQFQVLLDEEVPIISTAFGLLPLDKMNMAKKSGMKVIAMATTVQEGLMAQQQGVDIVVAQGSDAGGHRGTFDVEKYPNGANIGTFSLIPQMKQNLQIPVIAAGGVMNGQGLAASLMLGAKGVQMGTRFLTSIESGAHQTYQKALLNSTEDQIVLTKSFSGRPAKGIQNKFIHDFENSGKNPLSFPSQNSLTRDIRKAAASQENPEYMSLWAGQGIRLLKDGLSAKEIIEEILGEAVSAIKELSNSLK
ncbi:NAD(P)H-dependent flavin oxidoreductase [Falsibacillus pallidus]|uniref:Probable nitronate monooxygenase n=1 Tax=Falsibacillus pallidus TaxID=493781 RepID=A0A370GRU1_9BACI|nr:nitronate monooxygenase [Falsibacillus pallidus]RDI45966.1 nitronate monooxygenase [Falsibacillus pallidus]